MLDGAELIADRYVPAKPTDAPTVLIRSPYGRGYPFPQFYAGPLAARGFHVVLRSVRGTYGSTGEFKTAVHEADDGLDTVAWIRQQPWFTLDDNLRSSYGAAQLGGNVILARLHGIVTGKKVFDAVDEAISAMRSQRRDTRCASAPRLVA
jgi:alpha/beta superfamily hydrolase